MGWQVTSEARAEASHIWRVGREQRRTCAPHRKQGPAGRRRGTRGPPPPGRTRHSGHLGSNDGQHRPGDELLLRLRADRHDGRPGFAADHRGRCRGHRPAREHAGAVLPRPSVHRRLHHLRRQDVRRCKRGSHRPDRRGRLHHRDGRGNRHLGRLPVHYPQPLPALEHPVGNPHADPHRPRGPDDDPRHRRVHQARGPVLRLRDGGARSRLGRGAHQERRSPVARAV